MGRVVDIDELNAQERLDPIAEIWDGLRRSPASIPTDEDLISLLDARREAYMRSPETASLWEDVMGRIVGAQ